MGDVEEVEDLAAEEESTVASRWQGDLRCLPRSESTRQIYATRSARGVIRASDGVARGPARSSPNDGATDTRAVSLMTWTFLRPKITSCCDSMGLGDPRAVA